MSYLQQFTIIRYQPHLTITQYQSEAHYNLCEVFFMNKQTSQ